VLINFSILPSHKVCDLALVLLHGWGFDSRIWTPLLSYLQPYCSIYTVDLPGFGLTPMMTWDDFENQLLTILPEKFALAGWSLGALVAMRLALAHEARVTHLMSIAGSPFFLEEKQWKGMKSSLLLHFEEQLLQNPELTLRYFKSLQHHAVPKFTNESQLQGLLWGLECLKTWDFREKLLQFHKPVCFMFGARDVILPFALYEDMKKKYPNFLYYQFDKSGHLFFLAEQKTFIDRLLFFLDSI
jgi:pimeloyl-[acyl-carrier protein] methyl ester esterase